MIFIHSLSARASANQASADTLSAKSKASWSLSSLLHSESLYFFTGGVDQYHPSFDMLFVYDKNGWGGIVYKSLDLVDHTTGINYAMIVFHKHFSIGNNLLITPNVGLNLNQNYSIADKGSDLISDLAVALKLGNQFTLSNDAIFQNIGITHDYNWTNRIKLLFKGTNFYAAALLWDRNRVFNNPGYLSTGFDFNYSGIRLSSKSNLDIGASYIAMLQSDTPRKSGFMVSFGMDLGN